MTFLDFPHVFHTSWIPVSFLYVFWASWIGFVWCLPEVSGLDFIWDVATETVQRSQPVQVKLG